jgi:hypothetical protein
LTKDNLTPFSLNAAQIIQEYVSQFPEVFAFLSGAGEGV